MNKCSLSKVLHGGYGSLLAVLFVALMFPVVSYAVDINTATLRGRALQVRSYIDSGGVYRVELMLFTQDPAGGSYSPLVDCGGIDCLAMNVLPGCTPVCETDAAGDSKVEICHCTPFNPGAGECLEIDAFHDGFHLLATSVTEVATSNCSTVP